MHVLLTNDDGIGSTGIGVLREALEAVADVTVVAPADDQSAVGRSLSNSVALTEREAGYAVAGTPADCVICGLGSLCPEVDLVVSGCNHGANLGEYVLGRSGTVSAAVEASFFGVPAIAVSLYVPGGDVSFTDRVSQPAAYANAARVTTYLADNALEAGVFERADYLNVNAPVADGGGSEDGENGDDDSGNAPLAVTRPSRSYEMDAVREEETITLRNRIWDRMDEGDLPDPGDTDRRAVLDGRVSVSPLTAPHTTEHHEVLDALAETYGRADR